MFFQFTENPFYLTTQFHLYVQVFHSLDQFLLNSRKSFLGNKYLKAITTALYRWSGSPATTSDRMRTQEYTAVICIDDRTQSLFYRRSFHPWKRHSYCPPCGFEACCWIWIVPKRYSLKSLSFNTSKRKAPARMNRCFESSIVSIYNSESVQFKDVSDLNYKNF